MKQNTDPLFTSETPLFSLEDNDSIKVSPKPKRKRRTKKEIEESEKIKKEDFISSKQSKRNKEIKKTDSFNYEVDVINGTEYFRGKRIRMDESGFYVPYASMKDINEWVHKYVKKRTY